jgi:hypothetical protein
MCARPSPTVRLGRAARHQATWPAFSSAIPSCQIEGKFVPVADFNLDAGDGVYFAHHLLLWKDDQAQISAMSAQGRLEAHCSPGCRW